MGIAFEVSDIIPASPEEVYAAWLDSDSHTRMTGGLAKVNDVTGGKFTTWDGYIQGRNIELEPPRRILQSWRTSEFEVSDGDSRLEVLFEPAIEGTKVTIRHSELPAHGMQYHQGWIDAYFEPMKAYFGGERKRHDFSG